LWTQRSGKVTPEILTKLEKIPAKISNVYKMRPKLGSILRKNIHFYTFLGPRHRVAQGPTLTVDNVKKSPTTNFCWAPTAVWRVGSMTTLSHGARFGHPTKRPTASPSCFSSSPHCQHISAAQQSPTYHTGGSEIESPGGSLSHQSSHNLHSRHYVHDMSVARSPHTQVSGRGARAPDTPTPRPSSSYFGGQEGCLNMPDRPQLNPQTTPPGLGPWIYFKGPVQWERA